MYYLFYVAITTSSLGLARLQEDESSCFQGIAIASTGSMRWDQEGMGTCSSAVGKPLVVMWWQATVRQEVPPGWTALQPAKCLPHFCPAALGKSLQSFVAWCSVFTSPVRSCCSLLLRGDLSFLQYIPNDKYAYKDSGSTRTHVKTKPVQTILTSISLFWQNRHISLSSTWQHIFIHAMLVWDFKLPRMEQWG